MARVSAETHSELETVRNTVESTWVAIVLAFVLRAFLFEAFVIPTGSMAPRLMGEHWDLVCPACGYEYAYGKPKEPPGQPGLNPRRRHLPTYARCPNCRFNYADRESPQFFNAGDRVFVLKYLYRFREPEPWDVVVFTNPQDNHERYIKRLIGLPGEQIEIVHGDIFVRRPDGERWEIRRKPPKAQQVMWQVVFDNDYRPNAQYLSFSDCPRWISTSEPTSWDLSGFGGRRFAFLGDGRSGELLFKAPRDAFLPRYGYNSPQREEQGINNPIDVCSDLKLDVIFVPREENCQLGLELEGLGHQFRAEVRGDGTVKIVHRNGVGSREDWSLGPRKVESIRIGRGSRIALTHTDFRITLWVDGKVVLRSTDEQYPADYAGLKKLINDVSHHPIPAPRLRIIGRGARFEVSSVRVMRDVYYTSPRLQRSEPGPIGDFARKMGIHGGEPGWGTTNNPIKLRKFPENPDLDEFFCLGDNSPQSLDGRQWVHAAPTLRLYKDKEKNEPLYQLGTVPRYNMIGKAFFVYWPSGFRLPGLPALPIIPNTGRIRIIR